MCKQPYDYILYDCVLNSFRVEFVDEEARRRGCATVGSGTGMALSAGHRRRRALYVKQPQPQAPPQHDASSMPPAATAEAGQGVQSAAAGAEPEAVTEPGLAQLTAGSGQQPQPTAGVGARGAARAAASAPAKLRRTDDPEVAAFVERELQAVLLQPNVAMLLQHVLGVLRNVLRNGGAGGTGGGGTGGVSGTGGGSKVHIPVARISRYAPPAAKRPRTETAPSLLPPRQEFEGTLAREMASFLQRDSAMFATQTYLFLASGLSVRAYDEAVFGPEAAPNASGAETSVRPVREGPVGRTPRHTLQYRYEGVGLVGDDDVDDDDGDVGDDEYDNGYDDDYDDDV